MTLCHVLEVLERRSRVSPFLGNPESGQEASMGEELVGEMWEEVKVKRKEV